MVVNYSWKSKTRLFYEYEYVSADRPDAPMLVFSCTSLRAEVIRLQLKTGVKKTLHVCCRKNYASEN